MNYLISLVLVGSFGLAGTPAETDLTQLNRELRTAIRNGSLASAAELANKLDDAVQQRYSAWLIRDADERVREVLAWLPGDMESLWVNQEPFIIKPEESVGVLWGRPIQVYSMDRLAALDHGNMYRALGNATVRLVVAAGRNLREGQLGIPGPMTTQDVAYFYFFADPVKLPSPDESVQGRPVWRLTAKIDSGASPQPGVRRTQREDENWIALARPDLLILVNRRELLGQVLKQADGKPTTRALAADLPEWAHVDQSAPFWGLRHYTAQSKPKRGEPGFGLADLPRPDGSAIGVTVQFDPARQRLEIRYLSGGRPRQLNLDRQFQVEHPETGVWRLLSDVQARGPWPVHFALSTLGFGEYR